MLATAFLTYAGPFNQEYRDGLVNNWKTIMTEHDIPFTENINIISMLADNATVSP